MSVTPKFWEDDQGNRIFLGLSAFPTARDKICPWHRKRKAKAGLHECSKYGDSEPWCASSKMGKFLRSSNTGFAHPWERKPQSAGGS